LVGRRLRDAAERRALLGNLDASDPGEHVLVARFAEDDATPSDARGLTARSRLPMPEVARFAAAIAFLIAAVFAH
jgi:hypothetical protein